jgi:hypothetical protein
MKKNAEVVDIATNAPFAPPPGANQPAPLPAGWQVFQPPGIPAQLHVPVNLPKFQTTPLPDGGRADIWQAKHGDRLYQLNVITFSRMPDGPPPPDFYDRGFAEVLTEIPGGRIKSTREFRVGNRDARQAMITGSPNNVMLICPVGQRVYVLTVGSPGPIDWDDPIVKQFMDSLRITG